MKKTIITSAIALIITGSAFAQPVSDRAVVPVAITLNQILRLHVTNGGNIEFVFNTINDYKAGITNTAFYDTDFVVAASGNWALDMAAEDAVNMTGTDNPLNTLNINNVGFTSTWTGTNTCCTALTQVSGVTGNYDTATSGGAACGLKVFTGGAADLLYQDAGIAAGSGGDVLQNAFTLNWECGTLAAGTTAMNATSWLAQSASPDRYVTNVFLDLTSN